MNKTKLLFVPLLCLVFFSSCSNGNKEDPGVYHTIKFEGTNCEMHDESGQVVNQKTFEAGQTAFFYLVGSPTEDFDIPKEENVKLTITGTDNQFDGTFSYNEKDGALSVKMTADVTVTALCKILDPSIVTADEFANAISFQGVEYMQFEGVQKEKFNLTSEFSPNSCHILTKSDDIYNETYATKNGISSYTGFYKYNENNPWEKMDAEEAKENYLTPATYFGEYITSYLTLYGIKFTSIEYNNETKDYSYKTIYDEKDFTFKFKFDNKTLISFNVPSLESTHITYNEIPVIPPQL